MNRGFTLIEVLVSLVILSMITIITSNILQSSLETEQISSERLQSARALNLSSIILRRDIRQIINVPLRDYYGDPPRYEVLKFGHFLQNPPKCLDGYPL